MCLVSLVKNERSTILTSNRDEAPDRAAIEIKEEIIHTKTVLYPADPSGGSWIFCSDQGDIICLLNGAFEIHKRRLPYRMSRGLVMKSFFQYDHPVDFLQHFDFNNIEPFTMIVVSKGKRFEFRWDSQIKHIEEIKNQKEQVWSSCTLYDDDAIEKREKWFHDLKTKSHTLNQSRLREIHAQGGRGDKINGFVMKRNDVVQTISLTQIVSNSEAICMTHSDLISGEEMMKTMEIEKVNT